MNREAPTTKPPAIIFDFDGTIGDSFKVALEIAHQITHRSELVMPEEIVRLRRLSLKQVANELKLPKWRWPFLLIRGRQQMSRRLQEVPPFPGIDKTLRWLSEQRYAMFIMSSNNARNIRKLLKHYDFQRYFIRIYSSVSVLGKARALEQVIRQNNLDRTKVLYVGDELRDIQAAKRARIPCIAVGWGFNAPELLAEHAPYAVVVTPEELSAVIERWSDSVNR